MLQCQLEVATPPLHDFGEAEAALGGLRQGISVIAGDHGLLVMTSGTHPSATWLRQRVTAAARYDRMMRDLQMLGSRNQVCGLHVHVEIADEDRRISIMGRILPFLPLLLALSTSSPFWQGHRSGLMGYRLAAYRELPRTRLPEVFENARAAPSRTPASSGGRSGPRTSTRRWNCASPTAAPALVTPSAIAALYRCLVRRLDLDGAINADMSAATRALAAENVWRAQHYGIHGAFVDERTASMRSVADVLEDTIALLENDARELGCLPQLMSLRDILSRGTSADTQLAVFEEARNRLRNSEQALGVVVDWLASETRSGKQRTARAPGMAPQLLH